MFMIETDQQLNVRYVADCLKISCSTMHHITTDIVGYHKVLVMDATDGDA